MAKLIRDKVYAKFLSDDKSPVVHTASDTEYRDALVGILREKSDSYTSSSSLDDLAEAYEAMSGLLTLSGRSLSDLESARSRLESELGSYSQKIILDSES